jgi:tripartite-type tricarboxylate transporter receptor subunit TctC
VNPTLFAKVPYDPVKDFDPVTLAVASTTVLTVNPSLGARNVRELVDLVRANPGKYSFASAGAGTQAHLSAVPAVARPRPRPRAVQRRRPGDRLGDCGAYAHQFRIAAGRQRHIKDGKVRALAVTSRKRSQILPDVPTMIESGYPDIEGDSWVGILVPAGTPKEVVSLLHRESAKILAQPDMKERLAALGYDLVASTPEEFGIRISSEIEMWAKVIRAAKIKAE